MRPLSRPQTQTGLRDEIQSRDTSDKLRKLDDIRRNIDYSFSIREHNEIGPFEEGISYLSASGNLRWFHLHVHVLHYLLNLVANYHLARPHIRTRPAPVYGNALFDSGISVLYSPYEIKLK